MIRQALILPPEMTSSPLKLFRSPQENTEIKGGDKWDPRREYTCTRRTATSALFKLTPVYAPLGDLSEFYLFYLLYTAVT